MGQLRISGTMQWDSGDMGVKGARGFHKRSRNSKNSNKGLVPASVWKDRTRMWPLPGRDSQNREHREIPGIV